MFSKSRVPHLLGAAVLAATPLLAIAPHASAAPDGSYYVALGDSLAAGYQPGMGDNKTGGYVGYVLNQLQASDPGVQLENLSCSGEDTTTFTTGTICSYPQGSQLAAATSFLKAHPGKINLVTIDLGANDVQRCAKAAPGGTPSVDFACVLAGLKNVQTNLPAIMGQIRAAAPDARIVMLNYYNPFLAAWLTGAQGQSLAKLSQTLQTQLNSAIANAAAGVNAKVADVATVFDSTDFTTMTTLPGVGEVPKNVAMICTQTWMCLKGDIHANDTGYVTLGKTVAATVATMPLPSPSTTPSSSTSSSSTSTSASSSSTTKVTGPPVITDGPAASNDNGSLLVGAGALGLLAVGGTTLAVRRTSRR